MMRERTSAAAQAGQGEAQENNHDDYSLRRVPKSALQPTRDIALARMGFTVSASDLAFGYAMGMYFSFGMAIWLAFLYSMLVSIVSVLMGIIAIRERTSFALTSRFAFGRQGSRLPSIVLAIIIAVFYGYILGLTVAVFPNSGWIARLGYCLVLGVLYFSISALGFSRGLRWIARIGVPLMIILAVVADVATIVHIGGLHALVSATPKLAGHMTAAAMVGLGVSSWIAGAAITPDLLRFGRGPNAVVTTTIAQYVVGNFGFNFLGLILGLGLGSMDLSKAFGLIGLGWLATITLVIQSITVESNELYAASLAMSNALGLRRNVTNIAIAIAGIAIGFYSVNAGIINSLLKFIGYIGYGVPAIPAIILADYFLVQRMSYPAGLAGVPSVNWRAIVAFFATVGVSLYLGLGLHDGFWHTLPLIGAVIYLLLSIPQTWKNWHSVRPTQSLETEPVSS
jgi:cytosine permease